MSHDESPKSTACDLIVRGGTVIDGTGGPRRRADIAVRDGVIIDIGEDLAFDAAEVLDARGLIVAPGIIDPHTHYDAQLHWDPHCTNSGTHGATTVVIGNCGFGFAPCKPDMRERYMEMMQQTEQVPLAAMQQAMSWEWESFPEWMDHLRGLPKGVNVAAFVPMNPLMVYVMGLDAAKSRAATDDERAEMRRLLHEAMDAGALGFAFMRRTHIVHLDIDGTPMPCDVMPIEETYNLAEVLRDRGEGIIQASTGFGETWASGREVNVELARITGGPILHNSVSVQPSGDWHEEVLEWLDQCLADGLDMYTQGVLGRTWTEFTVQNYTSWESHPTFLRYSRASDEEKLAYAKSASFRDELRRSFDYEGSNYDGTKFYEFTLQSAGGVEPWHSYEGKTIAEISEEICRDRIDTFFDIVADTSLKANFTHLTRHSHDYEKIGRVLRHPRVIGGASDGGAHVKYVSGGQWPTDVVAWLSRDNGQFTLEEIHMKLSKAPADMFGFRDRGTLEVGKAADLIAYDLEKLNYKFGRYDVLYDLPDGGWRKFVHAEGLRYVVVNGVLSMEDEKPTGRLAGQLLDSAPAASHLS